MMHRGATDEVCKSIILKSVFLTIMIAVIMVMAMPNWKEWVTGLAFGSFFGMLNFRLLALTLEKSVHKRPDKAQKYVMSQYCIRYILTAIVLFIGFKADYMEIIAVIIGILVIKMAVFVDTIVKQRVKSQ